MANVVGKAERKEAEVAKLQRTVVNKEGQVGLPANIIVFVLSKCIFHIQRSCDLINFHGKVGEERAKLEAELARWKKTLGLEIVTTK